MSTVSLCLIVKNEEKILEQALNSIYKIADEIIIVDTGSTDNTFEIAKKFTNKVYEFEWVDDFSAARNYAQSFATMEYILRWDADWILRDSKKSLVKLQKLKESGFENADIIHFTWNLEFAKNGMPLRQQSNYFFYRRNSFHWQSPIHNELVPNNPEFKLTKLNLPEVEVDHLKDPTEKAWRYAQTKNIIEKELLKSPDNLKMLMCYSDSLIFNKEYEKAEEFILKSLLLCGNDDFINLTFCLEKLFQVYLNLNKVSATQKYFEKYEPILQDYPRFILLYADLQSILNTEKAINLYEHFLNFEKIKHAADPDFLPERYQTHPYLMLGKLYFQKRKFKKSRKNLKQVIDNSLMNEQIAKIKPLYRLATVLQIFG